MSFAPSLPPELLLDIFSLSILKSPSRTFSAYSSRQQDLRSFGQTSWIWDQATKDWMVAVAKGESRNVELDKIVIHGSKKEAPKRWPALEVDLFERNEECNGRAFERA